MLHTWNLAVPPTGHWKKASGSCCFILTINSRTWKHFIVPLVNRQRSSEKRASGARMVSGDGSLPTENPRLLGAGEFLGHVGLSLDITEQKTIEQALRSTEGKFRQLAENIHEVFWMLPATADQVLYVSPAYEKVWGRTCESLYQNPMTWADAIHPDDQVQARSLFARQIRGEVVESEPHTDTHGQEKWIRDRAFPIRDETGTLIRIAGIAEEITDRKQHEAALVSTNKSLEASEARYRRLMELSPDAVLVGRRKCIARANKAAVELFGVASERDLIGRRLGDSFMRRIKPE